MTPRIFFLIALRCTLASVRAVDLNTLPPINEKDKFSPDLELKGRELEAMEVALRQFREDRFSTLGRP